MAYIICEPCVDVKDTACVVVCPVDCIYEFDGEDQLYIHPEECIDCDACRPECPVDAIFEEANVPAQWQSYIEINREAFERLSVEEAAAPEAEEEAAAIPAAASVSVSAADLNLTRDRVRRILETVEDGTLDAEVALIQLTGVRPSAPAAPAPAAPSPAEAAPPGAEKIDPETPDEVREHILVVPTGYKEDPDFEPEEEPVVETPPPRPEMSISGAAGFLIWAAQPILGALPARAKYMLEGYAGEKRFNAASSTWWNIGLNAVLYTAAAFAWAQAAVGPERWNISPMTNLYLTLAVTYGFVEGLVRTWSVIAADAPVHRQYKASLYGWAVGWLVWPAVQGVARTLARPPMEDIQPPDKPLPGGEARLSDELERRRRYGMAHHMTETREGYAITLELPRKTPVSLRPRKERLPADLPDYSLRVYVEKGVLYVEGILDDPAFAEAVNRDADFPGSFLTEFALPNLSRQARHEYDAEAKELRIYAAKTNQALFLEKAG